MIKALKKFIRGGDAATVEQAITHLVSCASASCTAISVAGAPYRFLWLYRRHSRARKYRTGFRDIPPEKWFDMPYTEKQVIRQARLQAFKESLE